MEKFPLGRQISRYMDKPRDVIGNIERAPAGNIVIRIGEEQQDHSWSQTAHVVLRHAEAWTLIRTLERILAEPRFGTKEEMVHHFLARWMEHGLTTEEYREFAELTGGENELPLGGDRRKLVDEYLSARVPR